MSLQFIREEGLDIPVALDVDVVVCGGGAAGIGAALGAARAGAKTVLIERNSFLGGVATATIMPIFLMDLEHVNGFTKELITEIIRRGRAWSGTVLNFDPEAYKQVALELLCDAGVEFLFNTFVSRPIMEAGVIKGVIVENKSGRLAIMGKVVIDTTGDADVAYRAGVPCTFGRESDHKIRPLTINFRIGNVDFSKVVEYATQRPEEFSPDPLAQVLEMDKKCLRITGFFELVEQARQRNELDKDCHYIRFEGVDVDNGVTTVNNVRVYDLDPTNGFDLTRAEIAGRKQVELLFKFIKKYIPGCENAFLIDTSANIGVRESRRILGDYILNEQDILNEKKVPDSIALIYRRHIPGQEMHNPDRQEGSSTDHWARTLYKKLFSFQVPYRSFFPKQVENLLVVGRSMSQDHQADTWTRGMYCLIVLGQAAGILASIAARNNIKARELNVQNYRDQLYRQNILIE
ncbi:MAG: FAD-dependent oxidoreductase [Desulfitobacterium hafniense]|nr:FAD-dependent oxidoreductase [Desulfitobacterium hafniense]